MYLKKDGVCQEAEQDPAWGSHAEHLFCSPGLQKEDVELGILSTTETTPIHCLHYNMIFNFYCVLMPFQDLYCYKQTC